MMMKGGKMMEDQKHLEIIDTAIKREEKVNYT